MKYRDATSVRIFFLNGDFESSGVMDQTHHVLNRTTPITHAPFAEKLPKNSWLLMKESSTRKYIICSGLSQKSPFIFISTYLYRNLVVKKLKIDNIMLKMQQK